MQLAVGTSVREAVDGRGMFDAEKQDKKSMLPMLRLQFSRTGIIRELKILQSMPVLKRTICN